MLNRINISIGFLSIAIIAYQISLIQILSITQWYHFAYMIISIALLGFGAAGTLLTLFKNNLLSKSDNLIPICMCLSGLLMPSVVSLSQIPLIRFDSYTLFTDYSQIWKLVLNYFLLFLPFFTSAIALGLVFIKYAKKINQLYFSNLLGSGFGGLFFLLFVSNLSPDQMPFIISIFAILSGIIFFNKKQRLITALLCAGLLKMLIIILPTELPYSEYKSISKNLNLPECKIIYEQNSPNGLIQVVSSPLQRFAPGLSTTFKETVPICENVFINGNYLSPILKRSKGKNHILDYTTIAFPYKINSREKVLMINDYTGIYSSQAITNNSSEITLVSPNSVLTDAMKNELLVQSDSLFFNSKIKIIEADLRFYFATDSTKYDLISLPIVGTFGGTPGLFALQEQYDHTKESVAEMWKRLSSKGVISITTWQDSPLRNPLKIYATIIEVLIDEKIPKHLNHLAIIKSWGTITFLVKKTNFTSDEVLRLTQFCDEMFFDPLQIPNQVTTNDSVFNSQRNDNLLTYFKKISSPSRINFYSGYNFNIEPSTDNKPYFSQYLKLNKIPNLTEIYSTQTIPLFEAGYILTLITFIQIFLLSVVLIIIPLFNIGWKCKGRLFTFLYFAGIGLGYMFIEIILIQKFIHYFGIPIYSAAVVISSMLISSGFGSLTSLKLITSIRRLIISITFVIILILIYSQFLSGLLEETIDLNFSIKILMTFGIITPLSFVMGFFFPTGVNILSTQKNQSIAWAWGINGFFSVIAAALSTIIAVEFGFKVVFLCAAFFYTITFLSVFFFLNNSRFAIDN